MVNELCELAASGSNTTQLLLIIVAVFCSAIGSFILHKKQKAGLRWLLPVVMLLCSASLSFSPVTFAQSAENCPPSTSQQSNQDGATNPNQPDPEAIGGLVNDTLDLEPTFGPDDEFTGYDASFLVLNNDNAPDGDPFDVSTLQLLGSHPFTDPYGEVFLILDPNNLTMPDPNSDWWEAPNVWGFWYLELTCDPEDTVHCSALLDEDDNPVPGTEGCIDNSTGACWPNGNVTVIFSPQAEPGEYTIQYTVNTQSGVALLPATITATVPEPPAPPSPIASHNFTETTSCGEWPTDFSLDLMDGTFFSTTGSGTLLASTIDLDPATAGRQTSITIYSQAGNESYVTYSVDNAGILTMTSPMSEFEGYNTYILSFTIEDSEGFTPDIAASYTRTPACA